MILPIGHDESLRKLPFLTLGIMALCVAVQVRSCSVAVDPERLLELIEEQREIVAEALPEALLGPAGRHVPPAQLLLIPGLAQAPGVDRILPTRTRGNALARPQDDESPDPDETAATLERMRHLKPRDVFDAAAAIRSGRALAADDPRRIRYLEIDTEIARLFRRDPSQLLGYRPTDGLSPRLVSYAFAHGGWLHLVGNLLFLWLVGCNLEDRWGRAAFGAFYLVGAIGAALSFRLLHPGSDTLLIGASGAIAAAMGAFLVNFYDAEIRFAYVWLTIPPRWGTFEARAMFAMPVWFLQDLASAWLHEAKGNAQVAYSAHVGGFLLGVGIAVALRVSGIEKKHLLPAASKGVEWAEDPEVLRALDLVGRGQPAEAIPLLRAVLQRTPRHMTAALEAVRAALAAGDASACQEFLDRAVSALWRDERKLDLAELAAAVDDRWPQLTWSEPSLAQAARAQLHSGYLDRAERAFRRLVTEFPQGVQAARVRHELADLLERIGQNTEARQLAQLLLDEFPDHALAPAARERLARLEGQPDRIAPARIARSALQAGGIELPPE